MEREVRYCTTDDGVRIAFSVEGEGAPLLVCPLFVESFSLDHLTPEQRLFMQRLGAGLQLIRYDMRGTGLSTREVSDVSHRALVADITAVVRACGAKQLSIFASTTSGPRAIEFAARHPRTVERLVLYGTFADPHGVFSPAFIQGFSQLSLANWPAAAQAMADMGDARVSHSTEALTLGALFRESGDGQLVARFLTDGYASTDVTPLLSRVRTKTLVLHRLHDPLVPVSQAQNLAVHIRNARLVTINESGHYFGSGDSQAIVDAVHSFVQPELAVETLVGGPSPGLRTVLFTDLVGHTEMMSRLGDEKGRDVLRQHERITREVLKAHGGTEVKTMGDGFMASFGSVTKAVECAIALQHAFAGREGEPLSVRAGLNAGEPIEEEGDLFGATVILASRIAAKADGGEILVADTVRGLCSGKGFLFADRGEFVAKGFEEPVRVYEVNWNNTIAS